MAKGVLYIVAQSLGGVAGAGLLTGLVDNNLREGSKLIVKCSWDRIISFTSLKGLTSIGI